MSFNVNRQLNTFLFLLLMLTGCVVEAVDSLLAQEAGSPVSSVVKLPGPLVDTDWLEKNLHAVKILDVREDIESFTRKAVLVRKRFTGDLKLRRMGAHVPGAVLVDYLNIRTSKEIDGRSVRRMLPGKTEFEELMQSWGINVSDAIVIMSPGVSNGDMTLATRLYWQIKYFGHDHVAILDGGVLQWLLEEKTASINVSAPEKGNWLATDERAAILANSDDVVIAMRDNNAQLVDTRSLGFYLGAIKQPYVRKKGHIPGAKIFPNELLTSSGSAVYFTEVEDIRLMAKELGIDVNANIISYCNSGQLASASWFVFSELLGNKNVKLYDGSMHQWALEKRPVEKMKME